MEEKLIFYCDNNRHLICKPYSIENLHKMAEILNIKRCWFHAKHYYHYDIPVRRIKEITAKCTVISSKEIVKIIKDYHTKIVRSKKLNNLIKK
jgi:hypothetical protein